MTEARTRMQAATAAFRQAVVNCRGPAEVEQLRPHLGALAEAAMNGEYLGLQDCAMLMQQHLEDIARDDSLTENRIRLLREWPNAVDAYLDSDGDVASGERLLALLGDPDWPVPLNRADAEVLRDMLVRKAPNTAAERLGERLDDLAASIRNIEDERPETLRQAAAELEQFARHLGDAGETALQDCAVLLQQNLEDLAAAGEPLTDTLKTLLTAWSGLARRCLDDPADESARRALIENLCHPQWPAALAEADAAILYELFGITPPEATDIDKSVADNVMPFPGNKRTATEPPALARLDASLARLDPDNPATLGQITEPLAELADTAAGMERLGLQDICLLLQQQLEDLLATGTALNTSQADRVRQWVTDVRRYLADPQDSAAAESLLACLGDDCWPNPLDEADREIIREMLVEAGGAQVREEVQTEESLPATEDPSEAVTMTAMPATEPPQQSGGISLPEPIAQPVSPELVEMLASESHQMHEDAGELYHQLQGEDLTPALRSDALAQYATRLERFGNASQAAELIGLQQACVLFHRHVCDLNESGEVVSEPRLALLRDWPERVGRYLENVGDVAAAEALASALLDEHWIRPLAPALRQPLIDLLAAAYVSDQGTANERMQTATPEDVSIALPDDINPELLEGLLQELPGQTEEFSARIQALASGNGSRKDLERAQRLAHTVKGAANTVGVRGIANLTHQIEDLLVMLVEHDRLPSQPLATLLVDAADCLEEMTESLIERAGAPDGAQQTLQAVLDWVNRLERDGIEAMDAEPPVAMQTATETAPDRPSDKPSDRPSTDAEEDQAQAATLRVPAGLIDDLLRLVGETLILTAQLQEKVRQCSDQNQALLRQHDLFQELVGELEQQVDVGGIAYKLAGRGEDSDFDTLELEQYNELHTVTHRLVEAAADSQELDQDIGQYLRSLDELLINQSRLQREVQDLVMRTRMVPIKTIVPRLQRAVRQTCRVTGKQANLALEGTDTQLDSDILTSLVDPLMHMLRNAVDHGIESREERIRRGKEPQGTIQLGCVSEGTQIVVRCRDDGAGLNLDAIRSLAEQRGIIAPDEDLSEDELRRLILRPGFSTRSETTQTSGRGIGMDIVATQLQAIKGSIMIHSEPGQGTEFELRLPVSLMTTHGLLVRVRKQVMAISTRGIERILHPEDGSVRGDEDNLYYDLDGERLDFHTIDDLLQLPPDRRTADRSTRPALLIREEALNCAVQVENVIDSRDLVVKPLGPYLRKIRGIVGATILGDGSVVPVLDLPELIRTPHDALVEQAELTDTGISRSLPVALVVDDSISARRTLAQVVRDAGYDVRTARDGLEAASLIEKKRPDIVLTDLEMPRMNGIELASHLKAGDGTAAIPIIMITSRSTDKHRQLAESAGIDVYLTKPFSEDELLQHVHDLLERTYSTSA